MGLAVNYGRVQEYKALDYFESIFRGKQYRHRSSNHGNVLGRLFLEDLLNIDSRLFKERVQNHVRVIDVRDKVQGKKGRRGDGTFGEVIPGTEAVVEAGSQIAFGPIATIEIGLEVKILAKAMIKQIDRVMNDIESQKAHFLAAGGQPITVALVGVNYASKCTSYEGERIFVTDGKGNRHPVQEAAEATRRINERIRPKFDDLVFLDFIAENSPPYEFKWKNPNELRRNYAATLTRVIRVYEQRFGSR